MHAEDWVSLLFMVLARLLQDSSHAQNAVLSFLSSLKQGKVICSYRQE